MTTPELFTVQRVPGTEGGFSPQSAQVEQLWLPIVGPAAICVLRRLDLLVAQELGDSGEDALAVETGDIGLELGLPAKNVWRGMMRLRRERLVVEDALFTTYERPAFLLAYRLPLPRATERTFTRYTDRLEALYAQWE